MELLKEKNATTKLHPESFSLPEPVLTKYESCCTKLFTVLRAYNINEANRLIRLYFAMFDFVRKCSTTSLSLYSIKWGTHGKLKH